MTVSDRATYLFLSLLQARAGRSVISRLGDQGPQTIFEMPVAELSERARMTEKAARVFEDLRRDFDPGALLDRLSSRGVWVLTLADDAYPERLRGMPDPPPALFVDGKVPETTAVALVGSRRASATGIEAARSLGRALGERGVCVVSGLALGIDAAAHEGALAAGGPTVGVLGCGIDVVYPRDNRRLFDGVKRAGGIVSEYYLGGAPLAWRFPARNRIIAGLSEVVVVVEASRKSGALITARHALDAGRDVWAVPGPLTAQECRGSNGLLADGAGVVWDIPEFADAMMPGTSGFARPETPPTETPLPVGLPETEAAVLAGVGFEATGVDVVAGRSGLQMRGVLAALSLLELKGYVTRDSTGAYLRTAAS